MLIQGHLFNIYTSAAGVSPLCLRCAKAALVCSYNPVGERSDANLPPLAPCTELGNRFIYIDYKQEELWQF